MNAKSKLVALAISLLSMAAVSSAHADTINFDDINLVPNDYQALGTNYHGFSWNNFLALDTTGVFYSPSGFQPGTLSGDNIGYNAFGNDASFSSTTAFTLNSFYLTSAWRDGLTVTVTGTGNGGALFSQTLTPSATAATKYTLDWADINSVMFHATGGTKHAGFANIDGTQFALDNITFNAAAVPEPESYAMLLAGLGMMGFVGRRRRRAG
ncbi:MAG: hypothetical protein RL375_4143 [Pseudomonadota bacterium]